MPAWVKSHWPNYAEGCKRGGRAVDAANWRVAEERLRRRGCGDRKGLRDRSERSLCSYYRSLFTKLKKNGRIELFKTHRNQPDDEVTLEMVCDKLIIMARPTASPISCWRSRTRSELFGTLLYAGKDWKDRELGRRSMILMAEKVMPGSMRACLARLMQQNSTGRQPTRQGINKQANNKDNRTTPWLSLTEFRIRRSSIVRNSFCPAARNLPSG